MEKKKEEKKKFNFIKKKENTLSSLFEVEHFLRDSTKIANGLKLFKILK